MTLDEIVREAILDAVARNGGNKVAAAEELDIGKTTVYRLLAKYARKRKRVKPSGRKKRRKPKR